jgi:hypothetical protein
MNGPIFSALADVLQIQNIVASMAGVIFGLFIGSTPGLTISLAFRGNRRLFAARAVRRRHDRRVFIRHFIEHSRNAFRFGNGHRWL